MYTLITSQNRTDEQQLALRLEQRRRVDELLARRQEQAAMAPPRQHRHLLVLPRASHRVARAA